MFGKGLRLFKVMGFEVRIDASWLLLAVLIVLSLTSSYFPFHMESFPDASAPERSRMSRALNGRLEQ